MYFEKYLKYKNKYILLKNNLLVGGDKFNLNQDDIYLINKFNNSDIGKDMEIYLNPIYGYILCENGLLSNLHQIYINKLNKDILNFIDKDDCIYDLYNFLSWNNNENCIIFEKLYRYTP